MPLLYVKKKRKIETVKSRELGVISLTWYITKYRSNCLEETKMTPLQQYYKYQLRYLLQFFFDFGLKFTFLFDLRFFFN